MYRDGRLGSIGGGADEVMLGILAQDHGHGQAAIGCLTSWFHDLSCSKLPSALADRPACWV